MAKITGVTFKEGGKVYYFSPGKERYKEGMGVIVETTRGVEYATVVIPFGEVPDEKLVSPLKPITRIATPKDKETHRKNLERKDDALKTVAEKIKKHNLDMKLIDCEFTFDGAKAIFYYSAPQRVDFRELVKDLSQVFKMRIELRQVGIRDEIKMIGGLAPCGRECCCASSKISGLCGRLMCCLSYENEYYADACKKMPKIGAEVTTPDGKGTVVSANMIKMQVRVRIDDKEKDIFTYHDYPVEQIKFKAPAQREKEEEVPDDLKDIID